MNITDILKALLFGIVEGVTEWLPISSTGHMILLDELVGLSVSESFYELFGVVIQLCAIMAVPIIFYERLFPKKGDRASLKRAGELWWLVAVATIPSAVFGLFFDDLLDRYLYNPQTVAITLLLYGMFFILVERLRKNANTRIHRVEEIGFFDAALVGAFQVLALVPGTSRSGATILGGMLLGLSRPAAAEFSFFVAIPTMLGASTLKLVKFFMEGGRATGAEWLLLLVGGGCAFAVSCLTVRGLCAFVKRHGFGGFGIYRIALGLLLILYFFVIKG